MFCGGKFTYVFRSLSVCQCCQGSLPSTPPPARTQRGQPPAELMAEMVLEGTLEEIMAELQEAFQVRQIDVCSRVCTHFKHGRSLKTTLIPWHPYLLGRRVSGFHRPSRPFVGQAQSAVRFSASRIKSELHTVGGGRGIDFMHGRSLMTISPRIPTVPGRSTSGFLRTCRTDIACANLKSAVRRSASGMQGELPRNNNPL